MWNSQGNSEEQSKSLNQDNQKFVQTGTRYLPNIYPEQRFQNFDIAD